MKEKLAILLFATACFSPVWADSLRFTSGVVSNFNNVTLTLKGPTNLTCQVDRLNRTNQTWESMGNVTLNATGDATFNTTLFEGIYGYFRSKATNNSYYSTNGFGAVTGYLYTNYAMIGNPFGAVDISVIISQPVDGTSVYKWDNATTNYVIDTSSFGAWDNGLSIPQEEGIIVQTPSLSTNRFIVSGLFDTNSITRTIPKGSSLICSPLYKLITPATYTIDNLNTNQFGGVSLLPVQSTGFSLQSTINRLTNSAALNYQEFDLTNNVWKTGGNPVTVPLNLVEGFWIYKPTNATWTVGLSIW